MSARLLVPAVFAAAMLAGCNPGSSSRTTAAEPAPAEETAQISYKEVEHDGRIYVVGTEAGHAAVHGGSVHLPLCRTLIGEGPDGKTVVIEVDKKNEALADTLEAEFHKRHPFYREVEHDNRLYVVGSAESLNGFYGSHHIPLCRTFIGGGPGGKSVVIEVQKGDDDLTARLIAEFNKRHGTSLN